MKRWRQKPAEVVTPLSCGDTLGTISAHRTGKSGAPNETFMTILPKQLNKKRPPVERPSGEGIASGKPTLSVDYHWDVEGLAIGFLSSLPPAGATADEHSVDWIACRGAEWYEYTGKRWTRLDEVDLIGRVTRYLQTHLQAVGDSLIRDAMSRLAEICTTFGSRLPLPVWMSAKGYAVRSPYIACKNGRISVRYALTSGKVPKLDPHSPRLFTTREFGFNYDPSASCPNWIRALEELFPRENSEDRRIEILQEFAGWQLLPAESDVTLASFLAMTKDGEVIKRAICRVWRELLGPESATGIPAVLPGKGERDLVKSFRVELAGIGNWFLQGLIRLGRQTRFTRTSVCSTATEGIDRLNALIATDHPWRFGNGKRPKHTGYR